MMTLGTTMRKCRIPREVNRRQFLAKLAGPFRLLSAVGARPIAVKSLLRMLCPSSLNRSEAAGSAARALNANTIAEVLVAYIDPVPEAGHPAALANWGRPAPILIDPVGSVAQLGDVDPLISAVPG